MTYSLDTLWPDREVPTLEELETEDMLRVGKGRRRPRRRSVRRRLRPTRARRRPRLARRRPLRRRRARRSLSRTPCICPTHGEEFVRWIQSSLNRVSGSALPVTGRMTSAARRRLKAFQEREGLIPDGLAGPETEDALVAARRGDDPARSDQDRGEASELDAMFPDTEEDQFLDWLWPFGGPKIIDRTMHTPKEKRIRMRDLSTVYALVLHQTAFSRGNRIDRYNKVGTHYVILPDGTILQNHPDAAYLYASNGLNRGSVAVEFVGNFPNTRGKWWKGDKFGRHHPTTEQIKSGRSLVRHLIKKIGLTHVLAHRQSSRTRANDPGPDIWKGVGQWAVNTLGLSDGGAGFKVGTGQPIPSDWRTWKRT